MTAYDAFLFKTFLLWSFEKRFKRVLLHNNNYNCLTDKINYNYVV